MQAFIKGFLAVIFFTFIGTISAQAQTYYYLTLLDEDGNAGTGCTVEIDDGSGPPAPTMTGVDHLLRATVNSGTLSTIETATCATGSIDSTNINSALTWQTDTAHPTYTLSGAFIEYRLPGTASINASTIVGFASSANSDFSDISNNVIFTNGGNPISLGPLLTRATGVSIPWASPIVLLLIALTLGILGARFLRHPNAHRLGVFVLFLGAITLSGAGYSALRIALDGTGIGWSGATLLASDTIGEVTPEEIDLTHVYGALQDNQLHLKLHMVKRPGDSQTTNPDVTEFRLLGADITEPNEQHRITASGDQDRIRGTAQRVRVKNTTTNAEITVALTSGTWQATLAAKAGNQIQLTPINSNDELGGSIYLQVQGTQQEPTLPPDPINDSSVAPALNPQDIYTVYDSTKFLYTNTPPIQIGVNPETIQPKFASLIVGKVLKRDNTPLSGVTVTIKDHDQYGHTLTRADGQLDMVVNGGQWFVVEYTKEGYLPIQRKVQVAWQDYGYLPDVVMIPVDNKVSVIDLRETGSEYQMHQSSVSNDADGERQATILFPKGITATMTLPDGATQPLDILNVRATEYTVGDNGPNAMPGELPPATGYTYAVELSVDQAIQQGATKVQFNQPLPMYVDNFLDFPVGEIVPLGWYSYDQKAWVPDENGYVIQVLNIDNGIAALDVKGEGNTATAAELAELNITEDEQKTIAKLYPTGKIFWRSRVSHFTPWDCNFSAGAPECQAGELCEPLTEEDDGEEPQPDPEEEDTCEGCTIRTQNRSMAEQVDVAGTSFSLHYESRRLKQQFQYPNQTTRYLRDSRPLQQGSVSVGSKVEILGRSIPVVSKQASEVAVNEISRYTWDGRDRYGRKLEGGIYTARHYVTFAIQGLYLQSVAAAQNSFGQYSSTLTSLTSRGALIFGATNSIFHLLSPSPSESGDLILMRTADLGRWTLGIHHNYDPTSGVLAMGDGMDRTTQSITPQLKELKKYSIGYWTHSKPIDVEPLPDGGALYLTEYYNATESPPTVRIIEQVSAEGVSQELWRGGLGYDLWPTLIRYDIFKKGIYIADTDGRIHYRYPDGRVVHMAGLPYEYTHGYSGNNIYDPQQIRFGNIADMAVGRDGSLYIVDYVARCIRKLDAGGYMATVVGNCDKTKEGELFADGVAARSFDYWYPHSVALDQHGRLLIGAHIQLENTSSHNTILRVGVDGRVYKIAGAEEGAYPESNETNPLLAKFTYPRALAIGFHGDMYFATDSFVRRLYNNKLDLLLGDSEKLGSSIISTEPQHNQFDALNILIQGSPMKVDAGGNVYFKSGSGSIFMMTSGVPGFSGEEHLIPSSDGTQVFRFSAHGKHLQTLDALTGAAIYTFAYNAEGLLQSVTDYDNKVTKIERSGDQVVIVGPYGHRTEITKGTNGAIAIKNPAGETWQFIYDNKGLMTSATTPRGQTSTYTYDENGRLKTDSWPNGGGWVLNSTYSPSLYTVSLTSSEGRTRSYDIKSPTSTLKESSVTTPDGLVTKTVDQSVNYSITHYPDGTQSDQRTSGDPRFGVLAPYTSQYLFIGSESADWDTEANYVRTHREVETDGNSLLPVVRWQENIYNWSDVSTREYVHADNLWRTTTPSGKETRMTVDGVHRPLKVEQAGEPTTTFAYSQGLMSRMTQTAIDNNTSRSWQYSYDAQGNLAQMLDPLNRASTFNYDAVGRMTKQTLPDGRTIETVYDQLGNVKEIKTPAGDVHYYNYDAMGDTQAYTPPDTGSPMVTSYQYDKDRKLTGITLPDGQAINTVYGQATGRLERITSAEADNVPTYDTGGRLTGWTQGANRLSYTYGSLYPKSTTWSGDVNGTVTTHYDPEVRSSRFHHLLMNKGWLDGLSVTGSNSQEKKLNFQYDVDGAIKEIELSPADYGSPRRYISFERNEENNRLEHLFGWSVEDRDERTYDAFGAIKSYRYNNPSNDTESFALTLSDQAPSAEMLRIKGKFSRAGMYKDFYQLYFGVAGNEFFSTSSSIPIAENGDVDSVLALSGEAGTPLTYRLANTYESDDWWRDIGTITKTKREAVDIGQPLFARDGVIYYPADEDDYYGYLSKIGRYRLADGTHSTVSIQVEDPNQETYGELIGVGPEGQMYFAHYDYWNWDCGEPPTGEHYLLCITEQKEGVSTKNILTIPYAWEENITVRYVDNHESVPSFYVVRHESFHYGDCSDIFIERWDNGASRQIAKIGNTQTDGQCWFHSSDGVAQAAVYRQDLLLMIGFVGEFANVNGIFRVKPSGQVIEIPRNGNAWEAPTPLGIFADGDYTCLLHLQDYQCFDGNPLLKKQGDAPLSPYAMSEYMSARFSIPVIDESTNTVYYLNHNLWALKNAATTNEAWKDAKAGDTLRIATLTIKDDTSLIDEIFSINVTRDLIGRITEKKETLEGAVTQQNYQYDQAGRLVKAVTNGTEESWGYDNNGNRTHRNGTEIATFDAQDRIIQQNGTTYQHNPLGQRTQKNAGGQVTTYDYDVFGGLKSAILPDGTQITYALDPLGRRIGRKENGVWTHKWLYQDSLNPIAELDGNDRIRKLFIYADKAHVPAYMITYQENGDEDKQYRIVSDLLGSVRLVYDLSTGNEAQRIDYDVWGNITNDTNPGFQPFGFAGGLYDRKTKLSRFGARDYDAETARWTAKDPIGFAGGDTNLYGYVLNDPVNWIDPTGLTKLCEALDRIRRSNNQFTDGSFMRPSRIGQETDVLQSLGLPLTTSDGVDLQYFMLAYSTTNSYGTIPGAFGAAFMDVYSWIGSGVSAYNAGWGFNDYVNETVEDMRGTASGFQAGRQGMEAFYKNYCDQECQ